MLCKATSYRILLRLLNNARTARRGCLAKPAKRPSQLGDGSRPLFPGTEFDNPSALKLIGTGYRSPEAFRYVKRNHLRPNNLLFNPVSP
jgi:hypothetical protein